MSRKGMFKNLPSLGSMDEEIAPPAERSQPLLRPLLGNNGTVTSASSGAVGALAQAFGDSNARFQRAEQIEQQLAQGQTIIDLDPSLIDPSFIRDRMVSSDSLATLQEAIRENGQQVPILVRPNPTHPGRYQVAFGHRRLRVAVELNRTIRAVVREMTDEQVVVAQGQENNERRDLSFIEKCRFAAALEEKSFKRNTITAALAVPKSTLSEMLSIIEKIPLEVVDAIGPAPKTGRRIWMELSNLLVRKGSATRILNSLASPEFSQLDSDERLRRILLKPESVSPDRKMEKWTTTQGAALAKIRYDAKNVSITISRSLDPDFADEAVAQLKLLYERKRSLNSDKAA
jgi:ParB family chromosome partitioning protein